MILERSEQEPGTIQNYWQLIMRQVDAISEEEAMGKFVLQTADIKAKEKLQPECVELTMLKSLK